MTTPDPRPPELSTALGDASPSSGEVAPEKAHLAVIVPSAAQRSDPACDERRADLQLAGCGRTLPLHGCCQV
ncbi:MAG TPA: hypothetical protein VGI28_10120 [Stellaceae bacterium]|jgi:hypothetical protein